VDFLLAFGDAAFTAELELYLFNVFGFFVGAVVIEAVSARASAMVDFGLKYLHVFADAGVVDGHEDLVFAAVFEIIAGQRVDVHVTVYTVFLALCVQILVIVTIQVTNIYIIVFGVITVFLAFIRVLTVIVLILI